jgi:hypothetical protein
MREEEAGGRWGREEEVEDKSTVLRDERWETVSRALLGAVGRPAVYNGGLDQSMIQ